MKITLNFDDIKKLIEDSYDGITNVEVPKEKIEFILEVDGDNFKRKKETFTQTMPKMIVGELKTKDVLPPIDGKNKVDYDTLLAVKGPLTDSDIAKESHIPLVKTLEEKNQEARAKGLMTSGRGTSRMIIDKTRG